MSQALLQCVFINYNTFDMVQFFPKIILQKIVVQKLSLKKRKDSQV